MRISRQRCSNFVAQVHSWRCKSAGIGAGIVARDVPGRIPSITEESMEGTHIQAITTWSGWEEKEKTGFFRKFFG
jgi:hypothetical protein